MLNRLRPPKGAKKVKRRLGMGIGTGRGKTAGRGHKGQGQRGTNPPPWFEGGQTPLIRRIPKRGFTPPFRTEYEIVNIKDIVRKFGEGDVVTPQTLLEKGLVKDPKLVKVLGEGEIDFQLTVNVHAISDSARRKVEQAGGKVRVIR